MPSYEGKTDEVLHIKLPSSFLHAIWLAEEIAINGKAYLEVLTHWVGNKAPIKITIKGNHSVMAMPTQIVITSSAHFSNSIFLTRTHG